MKHYLQPALVSPPPPLEISESEYLSLSRSRSVLSAAFAIEENFDLVIGNYLELENAALSIATSSIARQRSEYQEMFELRAEMNRRAVNLLSTTKLFVDQLPQRFRECGQDGEKARQSLHDQYDASFEYQFMEALRNHVQHCGMAVHHLEVGSAWTTSARARKESSLAIHTLRSFLELDPSFKRKVLEQSPERVDFLAATRRYVESLGIVQEGVRAAIAPAVTEARKTFDDAIKRYAVFAAASSFALAAFASPNRDPATKVPVFLDWDDVRIKLLNRNGSLRSLSKCVVTSAPTS